MTEETRPGFLANYKIVRPGPARIRPGPVDTSNGYSTGGEIAGRNGRRVQLRTRVRVRALGDSQLVRVRRRASRELRRRAHPNTDCVQLRLRRGGGPVAPPRRARRRRRRRMQTLRHECRALRRRRRRVALATRIERQNQQRIRIARIE